MLALATYSGRTPALAPVRRTLAKCTAVVGGVQLAAEAHAPTLDEDNAGAVGPRREAQRHRAATPTRVPSGARDPSARQHRQRHLHHGASASLVRGSSGRRWSTSASTRPLGSEPSARRGRRRPPAPRTAPRGESGRSPGVVEPEPVSMAAGVEQHPPQPGAADVGLDARWQDQAEAGPPGRGPAAPFREQLILIHVPVACSG